MTTCASWYGKEKAEEQGDLKIRDPRGLRTGLGCYFTGSFYCGQRGGSHKVRQLSSLQWMACVCWSERISMGLNNQGCFSHSPPWEFAELRALSFTFNEVTVFSFSFFFFICFVFIFIYFLILFYFLTLKYCIVFACINMNPPQVYMCSPSWTLLPPPSPYHPSGSSQCTSPKHPVSCINPGLATRFIYDIIHVFSCDCSISYLDKSNQSN